MNNLSSFFICALILIITTIQAHAKAPDVDLKLGIERLNGDTTYQIGGRVDSMLYGLLRFRFPVSELEFPLDVWLVSFAASIEFADKFKISADAKKSITGDAGKLKDSDWGVFFYELEGWPDPNSLDVYSESDADMKAFMIDFNFQYRFLDKYYDELRWSLFAGSGFLFQSFDYNVSNVDQWYPSMNQYFGYDVGHDYVPSKVGTYKIDYMIPYLEIATEFLFSSKFRVKSAFGFSPTAMVNDKDNHILRSKVSKGECNGKAFLLSLAARYDPDWLRHWFVMLQVDYKAIDTEGKSKAYLFDIYDHKIDLEIKSNQFSGSFSVGRGF